MKHGQVITAAAPAGRWEPKAFVTLADHSASAVGIQCYLQLSKASNLKLILGAFASIQCKCILNQTTSTHTDTFKVVYEYIFLSAANLITGIKWVKSTTIAKGFILQITSAHTGFTRIFPVCGTHLHKVTPRLCHLHRLQLQYMLFAPLCVHDQNCASSI